MSNTKKYGLTEPQLDKAAALFSALGEVSRLKILQCLQKGARTVSELVDCTSLTQANVSKHLSALHAAKLVAREKEGNFVRYSISDPIVDDLCHLVCGKISRDIKTDLKKLG